jgi:hypothetical protein
LKNPTKLEQSGLDATTAALIKKTSTNPVLKNGMNVFGHVDFKDAQKLKSLLAEVGVTKLKLPLKGTISPKSLSGQAASLKNAIPGGRKTPPFVPLISWLRSFPGALADMREQYRLTGRP